MFNLVQIFTTGMLISFLGTLPLGSLNVCAMQIAVEENSKNALRFALGVVLVELIYVWISLQAMHWVMAHQGVFRALQWITVVLFLVLAAGSFYTASRSAGGRKNLLLNHSLHRFWLGFSMSAVNPVQIPFWFIWSSWLLSTKVLVPATPAYCSYITGIGLGTLTGLAVFIYGGRWVLLKINAGHRVVNTVAGLVFLVSALIQCSRLMRHL